MSNETYENVKGQRGDSIGDPRGPEDKVKAIKRCPFRKDEDGEFAECYGGECMAYLSMPTFGCNGPASAPMCRKLLTPPQTAYNQPFIPYQQFGG